ncbi:MAG: PIG-L family deacetylase [Ignavibacteriae bacterium]|nr:MAG: PIG-L family deacetylase [Ignavibacteriota bacterium]
MNKTLLAIGAHPDDIEFSCTGTMLKLKKQGYDIYYIVATNGEHGFKIADKPKEQRIKVRHKEQLNAAKKLGVEKVFFFGYRDGFLKNNDELRKKLVKIIKLVKPEIIFTFDPANKTFDNINLNHRDHRYIGEAVFDAVFAAKNKYMYPGEPHKTDYLYLFGSDKCNYYEDIASTIEQKIEILREHKSQFNDFDKVEEWIKTYLSKFTKKYKYSEAYRVVQIEQMFK